MWRLFKKAALPSFTLLLACGGSSSRFGGNKITQTLLGMTVAERSIEAFYPLVSDIVVVCAAGDIMFWNDLVRCNGYNKVKSIVAGDTTRQKSVSLGLMEVNTQYVAIHDGARPIVASDDIEAVFDQVLESGAACLAAPVFDSVCKCNGNQFVSCGVDRTNLWLMQTPQVFLAEKIKYAHSKAEDEGYEATDDTALYKKYSGDVKLVAARFPNIKITTREDLLMCEKIVSG